MRLWPGEGTGTVLPSAITGPSPKQATSSKPKALLFLVIWAQSSQGVSVSIFSEKPIAEASGDVTWESDRRGVRAQEALRLLLAQGPREPSRPMGSEWVQRQACFLLTCPRPLNPPSPRGDSVQRHRRHPRPDSGLVPRQPAWLWLPPSFLPGLLTPLPSSPWARTLWHQPGIDDFISDEQSQLCSHHPTLCSHQPCLPKAVPASLCLTASQTVRGCPSSTELWVLAGLSQPVLCLAGRRVWPEVVIGPPDGVKPRVTASLRVHLRGESQPRV